METSLEYILTSTNKEGMISFMNTHPEDFEEAIQLAISDKQPYAWRAAWLLWSCMNENDSRVQPYIKSIIETITGKNDDHQRELLKILLQMELSEEYEGFLFQLSTSVWEKIGKKPSVRHTAFNTIIKIAKKHPDLTHEITFLTQNHFLDSLSPAARKSIYKMMNELKTSSSNSAHLNK